MKGIFYFTFLIHCTLLRNCCEGNEKTSRIPAFFQWINKICAFWKAYLFKLSFIYNFISIHKYWISSLIQKPESNYFSQQTILLSLAFFLFSKRQLEQYIFFVICMVMLEGVQYLLVFFKLSYFHNICTYKYTFFVKSQLHKSSCGYCFWASDPSIDGFY